MLNLTGQQRKRGCGTPTKRRVNSLGLKRSGVGRAFLRRLQPLLWVRRAEASGRLGALPEAGVGKVSIGVARGE